MNRLLPIFATVLLSTLLGPDAHAQQNAPPALETIRGFQVVSDRLASADERRNGREGFLVAQSGLTYVHIPVDWAQPRLSDVEMFFDVMQANQDRKVFVHCFANMRASAFVYMYRTLVEDVPEAEARGTMNEVWDPSEQQQWADLIERVQAAHAGGR